MKLQKEKSHKRILLLSLMMASIILSACDAGKIPKTETDYHTGSEGLVMTMTNEEQVTEIYESSNFPYALIIENRGAYDVAGEEQGVLTIGFDPYYVEAIPPETRNDQIFFDKSSVVIKGITLLGKSKHYPKGSTIVFYFPYFKAKQVQGQRAKPETQIFTSLCYPYSTVFSSLVCVDFDIYREDTRSQVCTQQTVSTPNQGAPVAITHVEVENLPAGNNLVKPVYTVHVQNVDRGNVLSPVDNSGDGVRVCTNQDLVREDFNTVAIDAWLSNSIKLECTPDRIRLTDQEGISRCMVREQDLEKAISWRQNYLAPLTINLSYVYVTTMKNDIEIKRINPYGDLSSEAQEECFPFQTSKQSDDGKECMNKCDYCAENPSDAICNPSGLKYNIDWNSGFGCRCSSTTCNTLYPSGLCVPSSNFCPPASYCCANSCGSQIRYEPDGKCYPKCSTGCLKINKPCICGDAERQNLAIVGDYCSKDLTIHKDQTECTEANKRFTESQKQQASQTVLV
jgi:hypothetical protein